MRTWTLHPSLGWIAGSIIAAIMLVLAIVGPILYHRTGSNTDTSRIAVVRRSLMAIVLAFMVLTPSQVQQVTNKAVSATDVYIAVDVTGSMAVQDAHYGSQEKLTRLAAAQKAVNDIVATYPAASFAAIHFGTNATIDLPITPDARAVTNWADNLTTEPTSLSSGSSLDAPIDPLTIAMKERKDQHPNNRIVLYIISDGEQTSAQQRKSFSTLRAYLNAAFTVGVGSSQGGKVPVSGIGFNEQKQGGQWVIDPQTGQPGISKMDERELKNIADETSGTYLPTDSDHTVANGPAAKSSSRYQVQTTQSKHERVTAVVWPLALLLLALLVWEMIDWIVSSRRLL